MHKERHAQARARVGGAAREEPPAAVKRIFELHGNGVVDAVSHAPQLLRPQPRVEALYSEVVFLVHHDAHAVRFVVDYAALALGRFELRAGKPLLHEEPLLPFIKLAERYRVERAAFRGGFEGRSRFLKYFRAF
jgi:hypothetical protein